ncbi:MAG: pilus (MSHA type) biogenesis protein MshL [Azospira oryzae]|nr:MAG: pilus (MSHA type) biogenesis protein MshL [Azospira oryzae]PZP82375.1 MAG: pilus (MSHA type) biogenesis protein MshL [Azospira oryzae]
MKAVTSARVLAAVLLLGGCSTTPPKDGTTFDAMLGEMSRAAKERPPPALPEAVSRALLPSLTIEVPKAVPEPVEPRFDLVVSDAPAAQVFMAIVSGSRYSMLVHPEVKGTLSVNLRDVTVKEALDAIRDLYGYEYTMEGNRIIVHPLTARTKVFRVNYPTGVRRGASEVAVSSSSIHGTAAGPTVTPQATVTQPGVAAPVIESSKVTTKSEADFWKELTAALNAIVGSGEGRSVVVSPQSGVVVVRAMPQELKSVEEFLKASRLNVERQVMLEAKILEVELNDGYEAGINWAAFRVHDGRLSAGQLGPGTVLRPSGSLSTGGTFVTDPATGVTTIQNPAISALPGVDLIRSGTAGGVFSLAFQTGSFAALLSFLETQGNVHVLSSPRIATLNNQKAVLKVGQDELFVTNVSTTTTTGTAITTTPSVTLQSFFSGIALDVTPQIDERNMITLHIHPSVSEVQQIERRINLSGTLGAITIPVPRSQIRETDSIVRVEDGQIVAIGGLMAQTQTEDRSGVPGLSDLPFVGSVFRQTRQRSTKRELVILLKPTIIKSDQDWVGDLKQSRDRLEKLDRGFSWGGKSEVFGTKAEGGPPPWQGTPTEPPQK